MIAIAGGTGTLGGRLVPHLVGQGHAVRVLTRDITRARHLAGNGIEVVQSDVRDPASVDHALRGAGTVISAMSGFAGPGTSPASVDQAGNANLIGAAARAGAAFILMSVVGASPNHPIGLFRAKHAAEVTLRASGIPWTIVRATAFMETWVAVMGRTLQATGKIIVFGRGDNPVNFVSVTDVAALVVLSAADSAMRGQAINLGGPENLTLNQVAGLVHEFTGRRAAVWHIPPPRAAADGLAGHHQARAGSAGSRRARHGHDRHVLRPDPNPAGFPGRATDRYGDSFAGTAGVKSRAAERLARPSIERSEIMPSLESTNIRATPKPVDSLEPLRLRSQPTLTDSQYTSSEVFAYPEAGVSKSGSGPSAHRNRHQPAFEAIARRLRRACAHSARAWALAAGVPPDLTGEWLAALIEDTANTEDQPLQR